ncbi:MAG: hypothetical protein OES10_00990 [Gammaproteobacteria bacterium]|nr:hypothetical protein [Gammaproteobacteria bacterium]
MIVPPDWFDYLDQSPVADFLVNNTTMMITVAFHPSLVLAEQVAVYG